MYAPHELIVGTVASIVVMVSIYKMSLAKDTERKDIRTLEAVKKKIPSHFATVDEVMLACLSNEKEKLFDEYRLLGIKRRREAFCKLCLDVAQGVGSIEGAIISSEFSIAWRIFIKFLPSNIRPFYKGSRSIYDMSPLVEFRKLNVEIDLNENTVRGWQEELRDWRDVHFPTEGAHREEHIARLAKSFAEGEVTFRVSRHPPYVKQKPLTLKGEQPSKDVVRKE